VATFCRAILAAKATQEGSYIKNTPDLPEKFSLNMLSVETPVGVATASGIWEHAFLPTVDRSQSPGL
jgi:hypothetical protein